MIVGRFNQLTALLPLLPVSRHGFGGGQTPIDEFLERTKS